MTELSDDSAWKLLEERNFGHLGLSHNDLPDIYPVNYAVDHRTILFRTAAGEKLHELTDNRHVVFEVDSETSNGTWSVIAKGHAKALTHDPELVERVADAFPPWIPIEPFVFVRITAESIRGRQFTRHVPVARRR
ncbi:pyridoxamine 5'-phosphate oxidase family protein [Lacisediminihabitans changchengi]|uniref:Pyridoxamine 5'-phosphate oxidase family protein n=1 Tax=Lacisediminihabitans changchengi TaxID=2787634 RepID=A0A934SW15_9MICO|nr:pyridoxamine 5'-phosphate oxidase family protein [Lacisediminihabitans changchengi]MBK4349049.1 pyridoxamine 5'-phosphate oxidase family protein [Lacisediminihabitans changchengi]